MTSPIPSPFVYVNEIVNFSQAIQKCNEIGMVLVSIHNEMEAIDASNLCIPIYPVCWIGLFRDVNEADFEWIDGSNPTDYEFPWLGNHPDQPLNVAACVVIASISTPAWVDVNCAGVIEATFICGPQRAITTSQPTTEPTIEPTLEPTYDAMITTLSNDSDDSDDSDSRSESSSDSVDIADHAMYAQNQNGQIINLYPVCVVLLIAVLCIIVISVVIVCKKKKKRRAADHIYVNVEGEGDGDEDLGKLVEMNIVHKSHVETQE